MLGVFLTAISVQIVMPHFNEGAVIELYDRYDALGGSSRGILETVFTDPGSALDGRSTARACTTSSSCSSRSRCSS